MGKIINKRYLKSEIVKAGEWPQDFTANLIGEVPSVKVNRDTQLEWCCSRHGNYAQRIGAHLEALDKGVTGCPLCYKEISSKWLHTEKAVQRRATKISTIGKEKGNGFRYSKSFIISNGVWPEEFVENLVGDIPPVTIPGTTILTWRCNEHGEYQNKISDHLISLSKGNNGCPGCVVTNRFSILEIRIKSLLEGCGLFVVRGARNVIKGPSGRWMELDLYIPDLKIAIEVNGLHWHGVKELSKHKEIEPALYHRLKYELCKEKGIRLIQLWSDSLVFKWELCEKLILSKLGLLKKKALYARKCTVSDVDSVIRAKFYEKYHIQGDGQGICRGLFYEGHLIACMSAKRGASNTSSKGAWELNRYAEINNYHAIGGFEKLLKSFEREFNIERWISYADLMVSQGDLYYRKGWSLIGELGVDYQYVYKDRRYHKFNFRIERFKKDPKLIWVEGKTEEQLATINNLDRVYDCGKLKFEKVVH